MADLLSILLPVAAAVAAFLILRMRGGEPPRWKQGAGARKLPAFRLLAVAVLLTACGTVVSSISGGRVWALGPAAAGIAVVVAGWRLAWDVDGEARSFAQRFWADQGLSVANPVRSARIMGGGWVAIGLGATFFSLAWLAFGD